MRSTAFFAMVFVLIAPVVGALSYTARVVLEGSPVSIESANFYGWPEGALDLVNDPNRTDGWNPWFSELPNDVIEFEFRPETLADVNRIITLLAAVECDVKRILLSPESEVRVIGYGKTFLEGRGAPMMFSIGSQPVLEQWYERLPESEIGVRKFGVNRYTECPTATPPTLRVYIGNPAIDLDELDIPEGITLDAAWSENYRNEHADDPVLRAIDAFLAGRERANAPRP